MSNPFRSYDMWKQAPPTARDETLWEDYCDAFLTTKNIALRNEIGAEHGWELPNNDQQWLAQLTSEGYIPTFDAFCALDYAARAALVARGVADVTPAFRPGDPRF